MKKISSNLTIAAGLLTITLIACSKTTSPPSSSTDQGQEDSQCIKDLNNIKYFNYTTSDKVESLLNLIEDSKIEIMEYSMEIMKLNTPSHINCLSGDDPTEIPDSCTTHQDLTDYLTSQKTIQPISRLKNRAYETLITQFGLTLNDIKSSMNFIESMLIEYQPAVDHQEQDSKCLNKLNSINSANDINIDEIESLISSVQDFNGEMIRYHIDILTLTVNLSYLRCFFTRTQSSNNCTDEDLTNYLISQRRARPIIQEKAGAYTMLIERVDSHLRDIRTRIQTL